MSASPSDPWRTTVAHLAGDPCPSLETVHELPEDASCADAWQALADADDWRGMAWWASRCTPDDGPIRAAITAELTAALDRSGDAGDADDERAAARAVAIVGLVEGRLAAWQLAKAVFRVSGCAEAISSLRTVYDPCPLP